MHRFGLHLAIGGCLVVIATLGVGAQRAMAAPAWTIQPTPNPGAHHGDSLLIEDLSCSSAAACTAVGQHVSGNVGQPFVEHWNGEDWTANTLSIPAGMRSGHLWGVSCPAANSCMAVGVTPLSGYAGGTDRMLDARWDGRRWSVQSEPNRPGSVSDNVFDVSCASPTSCIGVGYYDFDMAGDFATLAEHWDGNRWVVMTTPNPPGGGYLSSIECTARNACVAVGGWYNGTPAALPFAELWDGSSWTIHGMPAPPGAQQTAVYNVACASPSACTAVGFELDSVGSWVPFAERWDGTSWALQSLPAIPGSTLAYLLDVSCPDSNVCVATGFSRDAQGTDATLVMRWESGSWAIQISPNPIADGTSQLDAVDCLAADICVAAGDLHHLAGPTHTLAEVYGENDSAAISGVRPAGAATSGATTVTASAVRATPVAATRQAQPAHRLGTMVGALGTTRPLPVRTSQNHAGATALGSGSTLDYFGGPVMPSNTNYAVYWQPPGAPAYPSDYETGLDQYFRDIAHDSGRATNVDSVSAQYGDSFGNFANYTSAFGGALHDSNAYPSDVCLSAPVCITDAQLTAELSSFIDANHLPRDLEHEYFLFTPPGVEVCQDDAGTSCSVNAFPNPLFCAYHGYSLSQPTFIYSVDPYDVGTRCEDGNHPNGRSSDGELAGGVSHEHNESITDPTVSSWLDYVNGLDTGYEVGDKCQWGPISGSPLGTAPNGSPYNQVINGHPYWYQEEWSNRDQQCMQRLSPRDGRNTAQFESQPQGGSAMTFDASQSTAPRGGVAYYSWQFNDSYPTFSQVRTTNPFIYHTFPVSGRFLVALTVVGRDGTSIGTARVIATGQPGPDPVITVTSARPRLGQPVSFNDAASTDNAGSIAIAVWNFGDQSAEAVGSAVDHTFAAAGTYWVTLTVRDSTGQWASISKAITVAGR